MQGKRRVSVIYILKNQSTLLLLNNSTFKMSRHYEFSFVVLFLGIGKPHDIIIAIMLAKKI